MLFIMLRLFTRRKRIYLDYAAATPLLPEVRRSMEPFLRGGYGNPSAIHQEGQRARQAVEVARATCARLLKVSRESVIFTGSGTESNNLAIFGLVRHLIDTGTDISDIEIITTRLEHPSVSEVVDQLAIQGVAIKYCPVDETGKIIISELAQLLSKQTALVSFAYANSEVGTVQPVRKIVRMVEAYNREHGTAIKTHLDAAQAPLWLTCEVERLGVDLMSLDAGKCNGPKGVGVLALRRGVHIQGVQRGGGQEFGLRAGTENVAGIVGAATALELAQAGYESRSAAVATLRDSFIHELQTISGAVLNGHPTDRLANNVNISIPGIDTEYATVWLDTHGVACSTKSACSGAGGGGSRVVEAMTNDKAQAASTLRFSLGPETTAKEIKRTVTSLQQFLHINTKRI
ncbi:MAG: cysteine desulfurase family protein [Candidatus Paceibacterota bacterium]